MGNKQNRFYGNFSKALSCSDAQAALPGERGARPGGLGGARGHRLLPRCGRHTHSPGQRLFRVPPSFAAPGRRGPSMALSLGATGTYFCFLCLRGCSTMAPALAPVSGTPPAPLWTKMVHN